MQEKKLKILENTRSKKRDHTNSISNNDNSTINTSRSSISYFNRARKYNRKCGKCSK